MRLASLSLLAALALAGCVEFPDLGPAGAAADAEIARAAPPRLVPLPPLLDAAARDRITPEGLDGRLAARAAALRARAARIDGRVLTPAERARLTGAAARHSD